MASTPADSTFTTPRLNMESSASSLDVKMHSIMLHDGKPRRVGSAYSIHFADTADTLTIPEPPEEDLPEFYDEEERIRAMGSAKLLAEAALADESGDQTEQLQPPCLVCCSTPTETTASEAEGVGELVDVEDPLFEKMSSKKLNSLIEHRVSKELSRGPSITKESSFTVDKGIVSFGSFLTAPPVQSPSKDPAMPVPLVTFLPPSPFFTHDGKLGVDCMAFKLDFTDKLHNIVPPFFLRDGDKLDQEARKILQKGVSYAQEIDMFGPKDLGFLSQEEEEEPSAAHKDLIS
ncbi:hypothetical protein Efla_005708 [Eimeria flavescens]